MLHANRKSFVRRGLRAEGLEDRQMMAGDMAAQLVGTKLIISEANVVGGNQSVQISQLADGRFLIQGGATADGSVSKVNGQSSVILGAANGYFRNDYNLQVNLNGGQDNVLVHDAKFKTVNIFTADAFGQAANDADVVRLENVFTKGTATITTGVGSDTVALFNTQIGDADGSNDELDVFTSVSNAAAATDLDTVLLSGVGVTGNVKVETGAGADYISVQRSFLGGTETGPVTFDAGAGSDLIEFGMPNRPGQISGKVIVFGNLSVLADSLNTSAADAGSDTVLLNDVAVHNLFAVEMGAGNDRLDVSSSHSRYMQFAGGKGNDVFKLSFLEADENLFADMGDDNDTLTILSSFAASMTLDGGNGQDTLVRTHTTAANTLVQPRWETINGQGVSSKPAAGGAGAVTR